MASVNWITGEITILKSDPAMTLAVAGPPEIYDLDTDVLRLNLKDLEDDADGRPWPRTHNHNLPYVASGVTYGRAFLIIAPYFVTFEDGGYRVRLTSSNNNLLDVATVNQVGIALQNSAGLTSPGYDATAAVNMALARDHARAANTQTQPI